MPEPFLWRASWFVSEAPEAYLRLEIARFANPGASRYRAAAPGRTPFESTARADAADLRQALADRGTEGLMAEIIRHQYGAARAILAMYAEDLDNWKRWTARIKRMQQVNSTRARNFQLPARPSLTKIAIPANLPPEFVAYLRGAVAYHSGDLSSARRHWEHVLELPEGERRYRSTWAAFMLGKSWLEEDPSLAVRWFQRVRDLADQGFTDGLGLAAESFGWEGRAELNRHRFVVAIERYLDQYTTGDPWAVESLRRAASALLAADDQTLVEAARNRRVRRVLTAYLASLSYPKEEDGGERWLAAVERAGVVGVAEFDRLALVAYAHGDFDMARRWVDRAEEQSPLARWILAKLLLRDGDLARAAETLSGIARAFPEGAAWRAMREDHWTFYFPPADKVHGELGVLLLARQQYTEALDVLLRGGFWLDAAYVGERVLTVEELKAYVDRSWSEDGSLTEHPGENWGEGSQEDRRREIRHLLARRLTRLGRYGEAGPYFPEEWRDHLAILAEGVRKSEEAGTDAVSRGAALFEAARQTRYSGMELMGTELEPDWSAFDGQWDYMTPLAPWDRDDAKGPLDPSPDEEARIEKQATEIAFPERFHYRRVAAKMAWQAAEMMPDNTDLKARVLCEGGSWLKDTDPEAADRFYKALVRTCRNTELGREADRLRWFPSEKRWGS